MLIYLASPYSHPDHAVMERRFEQVCEAAAAFMEQGHHIFSPIAHTHPIAVKGQLPRDFSFWEQYDREILSACGELWVLMLAGWYDSKGVAAELKIADELGIPVRWRAPFVYEFPTEAQEGGVRLADAKLERPEPDRA